MARPVLKDLPYGHFGQALYDQEEKIWTFGRVINSKPNLYVLGAWEKVFDGCHDPTPPSDIKSSHLGPDTTRRKRKHGTERFSNLSDVHTSLAGLEGSLYPDFISSWAVASSLHAYDPSIGDILAVGKVPIALQTTERASSIFACPGGESGSVLRLMETYFKECSIAAPQNAQDLQRYRIASPTDNDVWVRHQGYTIRQVAFSPQDSDRMRYLGVRSTSNTVIYTIAVLAHTSRAMTLQDAAFQAPGLDIERTCNLPVDLKHNLGHSDVIFNPWVPGECAVIDCRGNWLIYNVQESPEEHSKEHLKPLKSGSFTSQRKEDAQVESETFPFGEDGWARIFWVFNGEYLILCKRQLCRLVDLNSRQSIDITLEPDDDENWNLDVRTGTENKDNLFFLTNRKIFWVQLAARPPDELDRFPLRYEVLLGVRHFRDPKDMALKIKILEVEGETTVFLCSRSSPGLVVYRFSYSNDQLSVPILAADPFQIVFPRQREPNGNTTQIRDLLIREAKRSTDDDVLGDDEYRVFELILLLDNGALWRSLLGPWERSTRKYSDPSKHHTKKPVQDSFVVPVSTGLTPSTAQTVKYRIPKFTQDPFAQKQRKMRDDQYERPGYDMSLVYDQLLSLRSPICSANPAINDFPARDLQDIFSDFQPILSGPDHMLDPSATLFSLCDVPYSFKNVDRAYDSFNQLAHAIAARQPPFPMSTLLSYFFATLNLTSLEAAYESLVEHFMMTLGANVPPHIRAEKHLVAQTIAAETCLATLKLVPRFRAGDCQAELQFPFTGTAVQQADPSALPRASLLRQAAAAAPHATAHPPPMRAAAPRSVLGRYVRFARPLPRGFADLGSAASAADRVPHWPLGQDPAAYDYAAEERAEEARREMALLSEGEREARARRERIRERRIARESQRFEELSQAESMVGLELGDSQREEDGQRGRGGAGSLLKSALERGRALRESQRTSQRESQIDSQGGSQLDSQMGDMSAPSQIGGAMAMRSTLLDSQGMGSSQSQSLGLDLSQTQSQSQSQTQSQSQKKKRKKGF